MLDKLFKKYKQEKKIKYNMENTQSTKAIKIEILDKVMDDPKKVLTKQLAEKIHKQAVKDAEFVRKNKIRSVTYMLI